MSQQWKTPTDVLQAVIDRLLQRVEREVYGHAKAAVGLDIEAVQEMLEAESKRETEILKLAWCPVCQRRNTCEKGRCAWLDSASQSIKAGHMGFHGTEHTTATAGAVRAAERVREIV